MKRLVLLVALSALGTASGLSVFLDHYGQGDGFGYVLAVIVVGCFTVARWL